MIHEALGEALLDALTTGSTSTLAGLLAAPHIGLFTTIPTGPNNSGTAVSGGSYARVALSTQFDAPTTDGTSCSVVNGDTSTGDISFPTATASWGTVTGWGIWSALSAGSLLVSSAGTTFTSAAVGNGDTARFSRNALTIAVA